MNEATFVQQVRNLVVGKRLPAAVYIHRELLKQLPAELSDLVCNITRALKLAEDAWNVLKFHGDQFKLSYLHYPEFDADPYPALRTSKVVDLSRKTVRDMDFSEDPNPPILHRKELLVPSAYPGRNEFAQATREGEDAGLYANTRGIGFRRNWMALIDAAGYELVDARLFRKSALNGNNPESVVVSRERTAISRTRLSAPMQILSKHGFLDGQFTICDYGCGRGDDIAILSGLGIDVVGWDPNFRPEGERLPSDVVSLGYVVNVIEHRDERNEALSSAFALAQRLLVVAAMIASDAHIAKFRAFKDGVMTSRNTFQKYYAQEELKEYIEATLGAKALPVASGVFFIFKDEETEAQFAFRRYRRAPQRERTRVYKRSNAEVLRDQIALHQDLFDAYWASALEVGRWPAREEFSESSSLLAVFPTLKQVQRAMLEVYDAKELEAAEHAARDNLLFAQAMSFFRGRAAFGQLPLSVQHDVRYFHRTYRELQDEARKLLQSLTDTTQIANACAERAVTALPHFLEPEKSLSVRADSVTRLPSTLRAYVACAEQLLGSVDQYDLIKLHIHTGKVTVMRYDDFSKPLPLLIERIKVSLWNLRVEYFDYVDEYKPRPLYWKSKFLAADEPSYRKQLSFDERLDELGLAPEHPYFGFSEAELGDILKHKGLEIRGHRFYKRVAK